jgi:hypothetical protein
MEPNWPSIPLEAFIREGLARLALRTPRPFIATFSPNSTRLLLILLSRYPILRTLASHLTTRDLIHLAMASRTTYRIIAPSRPSFATLNQFCLCDGRGTEARQARDYIDGLERPQRETRRRRVVRERRCDVFGGRPCDICGVVVCRGCCWAWGGNGASSRQCYKCALTEARDYLSLLSIQSVLTPALRRWW